MTKNANTFENDAILFTHLNKIYAKCKFTIHDNENSLIEERNVNILLTDNVNITFEELEKLKSEKLEEYRLKIESEI